MAKNMYVPDYKKWVAYYANITKESHNPFLNRLQRGGRGEMQIGGSLSGNPSSFMVPIGSSHVDNKKLDQNRMTVNMISPTEQTVQMATDQLKNKKRINKKKRKTSRNQSFRRASTVRTPKETRKSQKKKATSKSKKKASSKSKKKAASKSKKIATSKRIKEVVTKKTKTKRPTSSIIKAF